MRGEEMKQEKEYLTGTQEKGEFGCTIIIKGKF